MSIFTLTYLNHFETTSDYSYTYLMLNVRSGGAIRNCVLRLKMTESLSYKLLLRLFSRINDVNQLYCFFANYNDI